LISSSTAPRSPFSAGEGYQKGAVLL